MILLGLAPSAFAASESGDAGDLPATAQDVGSGAVTSIMGGFATGDDADVYRMCLADGASFSASTAAAPPRDTQLFLFDADGIGVYANDDTGLGVHVSRLPARHRFSPSEGGEYYLAVSAFNNDPWSGAGLIFPDVFTAGLYPDGVVDASGPGAAEAVSSWTGAPRGSSGPYVINLTGTTACDTTPPTVDLRSPGDGAVYEMGEQVLADYSCVDEPGGSGLESCVGSVPNGAAVDTGSLGDKTFTVNAGDGAGNTATKSVTYTVVDATPPSIAITTPADGAVYSVGEQVTADYSCTDADSGVATCTGSVANGATVDTGSVGSKTFTVDAGDKAGNTASKTVSYTVADRTAPAITVASPVEGAVYTLGDTVLADYSCADEPNGSGLAGCEGSVADGAALDTSSVGAKSFEVSAKDNAGNQVTKSVAYSVAYDFHGFLWPLVNMPEVNRWKAARPVPVRFSLGSYRGPAPVAAGYPSVVGCESEPQSSAAERARGVWTRSRSKRGRGVYTFLWRTEQRWAGSCRQLVLKLDDGTLHRVEVQFMRNGSNRLWDRDWEAAG